jgi:RNA polymerase sigma factor (sigma-70 family)
VHLYNYGIKISSDRERVRGAIQKLFLNLWKRHSFLSDVNSVKGYLLSSLRRLILEEVKRSRARAVRNREYLEQEQEYVYSFTIEELIIRDEISEEKQQILKNVIEKLTPRQKEAVFLRFYHGLSNQEISDIMRLNDQCVRNLISKSIRRLREHADQHAYQEQRL